MAKLPLKLPGHLYLPTYKTRSGERKHAGIWWWKLSRMRVSTKCRDRANAEAWVLQQAAKMGRGERLVLAPVHFEELERMIRTDYETQGRRSLSGLECSLRQLRKSFAGWSAASLTAETIATHAARRRREGAAVATVNLELARLSRMLRLAYEAGKVARPPIIHRLPGAVVRQGFLEDGDFERIAAALPEQHRAVARFLKLTGWRESEALKLEWARVDLAAGELRLETSKNGMPRMLAFGDYAPLAELLRTLHANRQALSPFVFPGRGCGKPIDRTTFQKAWREAAIEAGLPRALIHDLRRSFVRACERAGVPRSVAMSITGHKSELIYRRYAIVSPADQAAGLQRIGALAPTESRIVQFPGATMAPGKSA